MICRAGKEHYAFLMTLLSSWMNYFLRCLIPFFRKTLSIFSRKWWSKHTCRVWLRYVTFCVWPTRPSEKISNRSLASRTRKASLQCAACIISRKYFLIKICSKLILINAYLICALRWLVLAYILPHVGNWQGKILSSSLMWVLGGEFFLNDEKSGYFHIAANFILSSYLGIPVPWAK